MKYFILTIGTGLLLYSSIVVLVYYKQRSLLYLPNENNYLDTKPEFEYDEEFIEVEQDLFLKSWFIKKDIKKYSTIVFFHGNAGNLFNRAYKLNKLSTLNVNILIVSWRGFSGNKGRPTEKNLYRDAHKTIDWLKKRGVENKKIILYGESLGTGVAVELGQNNLFKGIILESPFTSIEKAAKRYYPYLPVKMMLKDKFDSESKISKIKIPILVMHGKKDSIVPFSMGKKIFDEANNPKFSYFPENDDHMLEYNDETLKVLRNFLSFI